MAAYQAKCKQNGTTTSRCDTWGVVEVVDAPQIQFSDFIRDVRQKNEAGLEVEIPADGMPFPRMSYTTATNQKIEFEIEAHLGNQALWDIRSVDGNMHTEIGNWPYLDGDVISTISNGHHQIAKHGGFPSVDLDFTKELQPRIIEK